MRFVVTDRSTFVPRGGRHEDNFEKSSRDPTRRLGWCLWCVANTVQMEKVFVAVQRR